VLAASLNDTSGNWGNSTSPTANTLLLVDD
jgi:hypothetical protein